jgi:DNA-binding transcriptional LysR family regulator
MWFVMRASKIVWPIPDLEIFWRVAATGSMAEAGRQLGVLPAVVSKRIIALEEQQGARLFHRPVRRLELTARGRVFYWHTTAILSWVEPAPASLPACNAGNDNTVTITSATS